MEFWVSASAMFVSGLYICISSIWGGVVLLHAQSPVQNSYASYSYSAASCNHFCMNMKYFPDRVYVIKSARILLFACLYYHICSGRGSWRFTGNRLFSDECRASGFPILEYRIKHTWSTDLNPSTLSSCKWIFKTFPSFSSPSLLKTIDHTSGKKLSMPADIFEWF